MQCHPPTCSPALTPKLFMQSSSAPAPAPIPSGLLWLLQALPSVPPIASGWSCLLWAPPCFCPVSGATLQLHLMKAGEGSVEVSHLLHCALSPGRWARAFRVGAVGDEGLVRGHYGLSPLPSLAPLGTSLLPPCLQSNAPANMPMIWSLSITGYRSLVY